MNKKFLSSIYLVIVALIWGLAFVAQTKGMDYLGPFGFSAARSIIGGSFMFILMIFANKSIRYEKFSKETYFSRRMDLKAGIISGIILFFAQNAQQTGLLYSDPGKAGFITSLYIVIIPVIKRIFGEKIKIQVVIGIIFAMIGMYFLSVRGDLTINTGDMIVFLSAIVYSIHTLTLSKYSTKTDSLRLNCYQFLVCGILSFITAKIIGEELSFEAIKNAIGTLLYVGVLSSGVAYTLQILALKEIDSTIAALINSLESIFAVLGSWLILGNILNSREILGCVVMFVGIIVAQIPGRKEKIS